MFWRAAQAVCLALAFAVCGCDQKGTQADSESASGQASKVSPESQSPTAPKATAAQPTRQSANTAPQGNTAGPRWTCAQPTIDFGEVWAGTMIKKTFEFRNEGTETLRILKAKPRCSCSVADNYTKAVEPGATGLMPFVLKTDSKHGKVNEWLTIDTNDPVRPVMKITLTGVVKTVCELEVVSDYTHDQEVARFAEAQDPSAKPPEFPRKSKAYFSRIEADDYLHRVIKMRNTSGQPLSLTPHPLPANARFIIDCKETVVGEEFELTVSSNGPFPEGTTSVPITFKTNIEDQPFFRVFAYAYVPPRIEVRPTKIVFEPDRPSRLEREIQIANNGTTPFEIVSIACSEPRFNLRLDPPDPADPKKRIVRLTIPSKSFRIPEYGELVEIKITDAEMPVIRLDVLPSLKRGPTPRPPDKPLQLHPGQMPP